MSNDAAEMTEAEREMYNARDRERLAQSAAHIIDSRCVLDLFEIEWRNTMAGEEANAKLLYLVATSRLFPRCMHAAIKGPSSSGKSELRKRVLEFIPPEDVVSFTTLSDKALLYFKEDFPHKILSMGEASGAEEATLQDYLLRELISEGRLRYPVVQKVEKEGLMTVVVEKNGPVTFMVTTTKAALHPENETRMLSLEIDDSDTQTMKVLGKVAEVYGLNQERAGIDYDPWRDFQRWLSAGNCRVVIPFAEKIALLIPPRSVRLRRDFTQILLAIKAHALLHRQHRDTDDLGQIIATMDDYRALHSLMNAMIAESSGAAIRPGLQETMEAVRLATDKLPSTDGATAQAVGKILKLDKSTSRRRLVAAAHEG